MTTATVHTLKTRAHEMQNELYRRFHFAAGAVRGLGSVLFLAHNHAVEGINDADLQRLSLAVESLGEYLERLCDDLEEEASDLITDLKKLEVKP